MDIPPPLPEFDPMSYAGQRIAAGASACDVRTELSRRGIADEEVIRAVDLAVAATRRADRPRRAWRGVRFAVLGALVACLTNLDIGFCGLSFSAHLGPLALVMGAVLFIGGVIVLIASLR